MESSGSATFAFQAEIKQLLRLMVHSLYSDREIFLRELISNASDANDRLRFESLAHPGLLGTDTELTIRVSIEPETRLLTITDNGIGMSREEVIEHLGTIARSGTGQFLARLTGDQRKDAQLIGQFGVGFYSAFIVADEVTVSSRRADAPAEQGVRWVSDGQGEYSVAAITRTERGTSVQLRLKEDAEEFLRPERLRTLIRKYSDHIAFPVRLTADGADETVNRAKALWTRTRTEVTDSEYIEFYKHLTHDTDEPLIWAHNRVEGKREYTSLLYIPSKAPFDLWNREAPKGVKLYVQRVFITDQATQFLPLYLRFVRGVVDSSELSLNVSRELLQQDEAIGAMRAALTRRVLDLLDRLAEDGEKYAKFWREFGALVKEGLVEDPVNRERLVKLLRFSTTRSTGEEQSRSLKDYLADAKPEQSSIYFLIAESPTAARSSPHLEAFKERGVEVLLLTDRLDEWVMQHLTVHEGKSFKDVRRGALDLPAASADRPVPEPREETQLLKRVKQVLGDRVDEVRVGERLRQSAACLVLGEYDLGYQMREMLTAAGHDAPAIVPSLELNPEHPLVRRLEGETDSARFERLALLVFEQAVLAEGRQLEDPAAFVARMNELLTDLQSAAEKTFVRRAVTSTAADIAGPAGRIEAVLDDAGGAPTAVAVICHPHPLQLGTMQNKVVTTLARSFANLGATAVRFNFRGVGASAGAYADGHGERDDVLAVVQWSRARWPGLRLYLGGFSFGAAMALGVAARAEPRGLVTVAPPVTRFPLDFEAPRCPWLLVHGSADDVVPAAPVIEWANALPMPPRVVLVDGVGHYFHGHLNVLSDSVAEFFGPDFGPEA